MRVQAVLYLQGADHFPIPEVGVDALLPGTSQDLGLRGRIHFGPGGQTIPWLDFGSAAPRLPSSSQRQLDRLQAECSHSGAKVVLKVYNWESLAPLNRHQVQREIRIHARLRHPFIIQLYAAFQVGGSVSITARGGGPRGGNDIHARSHARL